MTEISPNLQLPYIQPAQAQKHVTHNEAVRRLDIVTQLSVVSADQTIPPAEIVDGRRYIVASGATGDWAGQDGQIAYLETATWQFVLPATGWIAWVEDAGRQMVFDGTGWQLVTADVPSQVAQWGVGLAVSGAATLFNHAGTDHRLKMNKAAVGNTTSLLFQTGFSGRAEIGLAGTDDLSIKVSADGSAFQTALTIDKTTAKVSFPNGTSGLTSSDFGSGPLATTAYVGARGVDLVTNGTGLLGNGYNYPPQFVMDVVNTPNLPAAFSFAGYYAGLAYMTEFVAVDPNSVYRLSSYVMQEDLPGDFSAFTSAENHKQLMGLSCFDADGLEIQAKHHMRYRHAGVDSKTTLSAPLAPGDTTVTLANAAGWNEGSTLDYNRGLAVLGYRNSNGYLYQHYTQLVQFGLFDLGQVNKTTGVVTLNQPFPASLGNPDDPSGIWPVGTAIANSSNGSNYKYSFYSNFIAPVAGQWFQTVHHMGGIDRSGTNQSQNFAPGTASVRVFWLPNFSNRVGGLAPHPDTGATHKVRFAGVSVRPADLAELRASATASTSGAWDVRVPVANVTTGAVSMANASLQVRAV